MKKDTGLVFRIVLMLGDIFAIILAFAFAYFFRTHIDSRPYFFDAEPLHFIITIITLVPAWLVILSLFGLYRPQIYLASSCIKENFYLLLASIVGVMMIITYDFFANGSLFPVRIIAVYACVLCFFALIITRTILKFFRKLALKKQHGVTRVIVIGNNPNTLELSNFIAAHPESGYKIVSIIANNKFIPKTLKKYKISSLKEALRRKKPDVIFQTDEKNIDYIYSESVKRHLAYYTIPSATNLSVKTGETEFIGNMPAVPIQSTPLISTARFTKRLTDIIFSLILLILAIIPIFLIFILQKILMPSAPAFFKNIRLSRYNKKVSIYKFRSMKPEFSGLTPEQAFTKIGKPELIKKYRESGDFLLDDPRITKFGAFLRSTSLDELPQLFNVLRGDISLVGPRALVPHELKNYGDRSLLLSVKSGLTGLAQVSGRRDISFTERRALDIYYIQNWSLLLDLQIIFRTVGVVLTRKGSK